MAYCANCGHQISDLATACPQCGQPTGVGTDAPVVAGGELAGFWVRLVALLIDGIMLGVAGALLFGRNNGAGFVVSFLYHWLLIALWDGKTVGKMIMGIRIAKPDGSAVDLGTSAARAGMALVSGLALGIGYLWAAWDEQNRTWHDMVADTRAFRVTR
jgi:uncharacterized RDD family membrane protein YckC